MTTLSLAAEFANISLENNDIDTPTRAFDNDVRTLRDLELALVGGGENIPAWGTNPNP